MKTICAFSVSILMFGLSQAKHMLKEATEQQQLATLTETPIVGTYGKQYGFN
jgi:hypothetical protein